MQDLIILGTGVHGAEMAEIVERVNQVERKWNLIGHIAPRETDETEFHGRPILGTKEALERCPGAVWIPDNEFPRGDLAALPRERFITLIDPSVFVSSTAKIGKGCVFYPNCYIGLKATIGDFVFALSGSVINHDDRIEDRVVFASGATLAGFVTVESDCYLGQSCSVRQSLTIGQKSLIGMGAVVIRDVPPNSVMVGNPARKLRDR